MFDTMNIAKRIKQARIEKNMTQMALADAMGVSFQAVSNWERGNSMPDISKLADLCAALDITVNELLGIEAPAVTKIMEKEDLTMEELVEVAPMLPPQTVREQMEAQRNEMEHWLQVGLQENLENLSDRMEDTFRDKEMGEQPAKKAGKKKKLKLDKIADMAPFLDQEYLDELVMEADPEDLNGIDELAPFLSKETLEKLVDRAAPESFEELAEIAPFLGKTALDKLVKRCAAEGEVDCIVELAPFASKETLDHLIDSLIAKGFDPEEMEDFPFGDISDLYPFLSKETLRKLAQYMMQQRDLDNLEEIMPFI